jgi:hypothetical protein
MFDGFLLCDWPRVSNVPGPNNGSINHICVSHPSPTVIWPLFNSLPYGCPACSRRPQAFPLTPYQAQWQTITAKRAHPAMPQKRVLPSPTSSSTNVVALPWQRSTMPNFRPSSLPSSHFYIQLILLALQLVPFQSLLCCGCRFLHRCVSTDSPCAINTP